MIEVYKMTHGLTNVNFNQFFSIIPDGPSSSTRGHSFKLAVPHVKTEKRRNFFSVRVIKQWNKLPADVVHSANLNIFKSKYKKYARVILPSSVYFYLVRSIL